MKDVTKVFPKCKKCMTPLIFVNSSKKLFELYGHKMLDMIIEMAVTVGKDGHKNYFQIYRCQKCNKYWALNQEEINEVLWKLNE